MKKILLVVCIIAASLLLLSACSEDMPSSVESGYSVSGIVLSDDKPLEGVAVWSGGEIVATTDANGVYSATGLEKYSSVSFKLEGYTFSPASYTVTGDANDYNVQATVASPPSEDDPSDPDGPDDPDVPDVPDIPDLPEEPDEPDPPEPDPLTAPAEFFAAYAADGSRVIGFDADPHTEEISVSVEKDGHILSAKAALDDGILDFGETTVNFDVTETEKCFEIVLYADGLAALLGGRFSITVTVSAENMLSAESGSFSCDLAVTPPRISTPVLANGVLSWTATALPDGCVFAVLANGVKVAETSASSIALADTDLPVPEGASLSVAAMLDGVPVAFSDPLDL